MLKDLKLCAFVTATFTMMMATATTLADQRHVPSQYPSIQSAVDAALSDDIVMVAPGTYREAIDLRGKQITVRGAGAGSTIIDGAGLGSSLLIAQFGETLDTVVEGFTFTNGEGSYSDVLPNCSTPDPGEPTRTGPVGGAVYVAWGSLTIRDCHFYRNGHATRIGRGAAIYLFDFGGLHVDRCVFEENGAGAGNETARGGAIGRCTTEGALGDELRVTACSFINNRASYGAGVFNTTDAMTVSDSTFTGNASSYGAGIYAVRASGTGYVTRCRFSGNAASFGGGAHLIALQERAAIAPGFVIEGCEFDDNEAGFGGGLYATTQARSSATVKPFITLSNSRFTRNTAGPNATTGIIWSSCFQDGLTWGTYYGAGADLRDFNGGEITVAGCLFAGNFGTTAGGLHVATCGESPLSGMYGGTVRISNVTAVGNTPDGIHVRVGLTGDVGIANSIVRDNTGSSQLTARLIDPYQDRAVIRVTHSNVQGGFEGTGNIDSTPLFVSAAAGNYRLMAGSPAIDAGDNIAVPVTLAIDLAGDPRFVDDPATVDSGIGPAPVVDMGAFEFQATGCPADFNHSGSVTVQDIFDFLGAYFTAAPAADVNASGDVTVQDIFEFLAAYFTGCP
jgi:hypothetical protein